MAKNRDDFSKDTIRRAAGRVGYRCSFPGCGNPTIGASMENKAKLSIIGVAAHICAAAEGGPRYDKNMSPAERSDISNCIWMCQTHSKIIDTDVNTYTVERLRTWKKEAEEASVRALANRNFFDVYYGNNGDNLQIMEQMFSDLIFTGQYDTLSTLLEQYKASLSEPYNELVLRYKIIHDTYCRRDQLNNDLNTYCNLPSKNGADTLIGLFLSFHMNDELSRVIPFCSSQVLKEYADLALSNSLINRLYGPVGSNSSIKVPEEVREIVLKYISNYIRQTAIVGATDTMGKKYEFYSDEFFYHVLSSIYELSSESIYGAGDFTKLTTGPDFLFIKNNIEKIKLLDTALQEYFWSQFLIFLAESPDQFAIYYEQCPNIICSQPRIQRAKYVSTILSDAASIDVNELLAFVDANNMHDIFLLYLDHLDTKSANDILDEHGYLFRKDSAYIAMKIGKAIENDADAIAFLEKFQDLYSEDFCFHLLLAKHSDTEQRRDKETNWLKQNLDKMHAHSLSNYIGFLHNHGYWGDLHALSKRHLPNESVFYIASNLLESNQEEYIRTSQKLLQGLVDVGWNRPWLYYNLGLTQKKSGYIEEATHSFQKEYDLYGEIQSLFALIQIRYEHNDFSLDRYFDQLKAFVDPVAQNLVAAIYLKRQNFTEARKYFLRSLLLNDKENLSINGLYHSISRLPEVEVNSVGENTVCVLKNDDGKHTIAIHENAVMEWIDSPSTFANCSHYSIQENKIAPLLFCTEGDNVVLDGVSYIIEEITSVNIAVSKFFFSTLLNRKDVHKIYTSNTEEMLAEITSILQESSDDLSKRINEYNEMEARLPLSGLSKILGKEMLTTCEFLAFRNQENIRNNLAESSDLNIAPIFVLGYDAFVFLAHLEIDVATFNSMELICASQVKNQLLNDIGEEMSSLMNKNQAGSMHYDKGELSLIEYTSEMRRNRYSFLSRFKKFLDSVHSVENLPTYEPSDGPLKDELMTLFIEGELFCERASLGLAHNTHNAVLVTDDEFLFSIARAEGIANIGITGFLTHTNLGWQDLIAASKKLRNMNFVNYLPVTLYKSIVDQILQCGPDIEKASAEIQKWIYSDSDEAPTPLHEDIITQLFREVKQRNWEYLNPDNFLDKLAVSIYIKRNPDVISRWLKEYVMSLGTDEAKTTSRK